MLTFQVMLANFFGIPPFRGTLKYDRLVTQRLNGEDGPELGVAKLIWSLLTSMMVKHRYVLSLRLLADTQLE
jgi:hypothetical protein